MGSSLREKLLAAKGGFRRVEIKTPEVVELLGGEPLFLRELSAAERDEHEASRIKVKFTNKPNDPVRREMDLRNLRARLLVKVLVDADGKRVFTTGDIEELGALPARILDPLFEMAVELSGMNKDAEEELAKNLNGQASASHTSSSPGTFANPT